MKVLYDHQAFTMQYFGGVSKCFCELISRLPTNIDYTISIKQSNNIHLKDSKLCDYLEPVKIDRLTYLEKYHFKGRSKVWNMLMKTPFFLPAEKINQKESVKNLECINWNVFHPTFFDPYFIPYLNDKPYVLTVHDMISELYPIYGMKEQCRYKLKTVEHAAAIVVVSENTKQDLCDILNVPERKVHVIYHGGPEPERIMDAPIIDGKYFLYVGIRKAYKNFDKLLEEFSYFSFLHPEVNLVCTGQPFTSEEINKFAKYKIKDKIIYLHPSDRALKNLYAYAIAFIYPSEYEGFGMPILEAYAYGCPVLLNRKSCFPEIAGEAALYFDTDEKQSICHALSEIYSYTDERRNKLIEKGYIRLKHFSWTQSAEKLARVYESLI